MEESTDSSRKPREYYRSALQLEDLDGENSSSIDEFILQPSARAGAVVEIDRDTLARNMDVVQRAKEFLQRQLIARGMTVPPQGAHFSHRTRPRQMPPPTGGAAPGLADLVIRSDETDTSEAALDSDLIRRKASRSRSVPAFGGGGAAASDTSSSTDTDDLSVQFPLGQPRGNYTEIVTSLNRIHDDLNRVMDAISDGSPPRGLSPGGPSQAILRPAVNAVNGDNPPYMSLPSSPLLYGSATRLETAPSPMPQLYFAPTPPVHPPPPFSRPLSAWSLPRSPSLTSTSNNPYLRHPQHMVNWTESGPLRPADQEMQRKWHRYFGDRRPLFQSGWSLGAGPPPPPPPPPAVTKEAPTAAPKGAMPGGLSVEERLAEQRAWLRRFELRVKSGNEEGGNAPENEAAPRLQEEVQSVGSEHNSACGGCTRFYPRENADSPK